MNICVFCSANDLDEVYVRPARELAEMLGEAGHTLLWGGSDCGLMKVVADGVQSRGGKLVGVTIERFKEIARHNTDEMIVARDLSERKMTQLKRADAIVVLPGGLGTLNELTEAIEQKRHGVHTCGIIVLNTSGFYDGLKRQLRHMNNEGFLPMAELGESEAEPIQWVRFVETPEDALEVIAKAG
jgi:uncharacterized protein (TIGR00730 family)